MAFEFETSEVAIDAGASPSAVADMINGNGGEVTSQPVAVEQPVTSEDSSLAGTDEPEIDEVAVSIELNRQIDEWDTKVWQAQEKYDQQIVDLRNQQVEAALEMSKAIEVAKHKRSVHKNVLEELEQMLAEGPFVPTKPTWDSVLDGMQKAAKAAATGESVDVQITADWESIATESVIKDLDGMGPKKLDQITHLYPTLGKLQAARTEASVDHKEFCEMLPKGCGRELASRIEDAVDQAILKVS